MIYLDYFGMKEPPFDITPDTSFFCASTSIQAALNTLMLATAAGEGFIKITGEVGTGKTLLCRKFLATLGDRYVGGYIPNPRVDAQTFLAALARELGCRLGRGVPHQDRLVEKISRRLLELAAEGKRAILCVDEAQAMPIETMETLRLLSNLETEKRKLIQIALFGQPELDRKLARPEIRQLNQRITFAYRLAPLSREETTRYLSHRLNVAGCAGGDMFTRPAMHSIYRASRGVPRLVNILANKTLMLAYGQGERVVRWREARTAVRDTPAARGAAGHWLTGWFA